MTSFFLTGSSQTARTLIDGESGFVNQGVALFTFGVDAVSVSGAANIVAMGTIGASNADAVEITAPISRLGMTVGMQGSLLSTTGRALTGSVTEEFLLNNAGLISGSQEAIAITAAAGGIGSPDFQITNSGTISSNSTSLTDPTIQFIFATSGTIEFANSGVIMNGGNSSVIEIAGATLSLGNTGTIQGADNMTAILSGTGGDYVDNTGAIIGAVRLGEGHDSLVNHGDILGTINLGVGSDYLENSGTIAGTVDLADGSAILQVNDSVLNSGTISGSVFLGNGDDYFANSGGSVGGSVYGGGGNDIYVLDRADIQIGDSQGIDRVEVSVDYTLGAGIEELTLRGASGLVGKGNGLGNRIIGSQGDDTILGRGGNDILSGELGEDIVHGGRGNDVFYTSADDQMYGGLGDDVFYMSDGDMTIEGGDGRDLISFQFTAIGGITLNLNSGVGGIDGSAWIVSGIEDVIGGSVNDILGGSAGDNELFGYLGDDRLNGAAGNDTLNGGRGSDTLIGGSGDDVFVFDSVLDSTITAEDLIEGFIRNRDDIDLSRIIAETSGDGAFTFLGTAAFSAGPDGQVRFQYDAVNDVTLVEVRLGLSVANDMEILLKGQIALQAGDLIL